MDSSSKEKETSQFGKVKFDEKDLLAEDGFDEDYEDEEDEEEDEDYEDYDDESVENFALQVQNHE